MNVSKTVLQTTVTERTKVTSYLKTKDWLEFENRKQRKDCRTSIQIIPKIKIKRPKSKSQTYIGQTVRELKNREDRSQPTNKKSSIGYREVKNKTKPPNNGSKKI